MKTTMTALITSLLVAGCAETTNLHSAVFGRGGEGATTIQSRLGAAGYAIAPEEVLPTPAAKHVSLHAYTRLASAPECARVISLNFSSMQGYENTLIALRNRAAALGANTVAITNYREGACTTFECGRLPNMQMTGHFYSCTKKNNI